MKYAVPPETTETLIQDSSINRRIEAHEVSQNVSGTLWHHFLVGLRDLCLHGNGLFRAKHGRPGLLGFVYFFTR